MTAQITLRLYKHAEPEAAAEIERRIFAAPPIEHQPRPVTLAAARARAAAAGLAAMEARAAAVGERALKTGRKVVVAILYQAMDDETVCLFSDPMGYAAASKLAGEINGGHNVVGCHARIASLADRKLKEYGNARVVRMPSQIIAENLAEEAADAAADAADDAARAALEAA